ncbi:MAG: TonB-dependent receptor [Muribaculaceae bacterium]|nr:TonB-dependent receptor [Muribaculaceae bacterium]
MKRSILSAMVVVMTSVSALAQENITVRGTVVSRADGEPLIGATVMSEATKKGTATDLDGNFQIQAPKGSKLTFSYVGYNSTTLGAEPEMNVYLDENSAVLNEVVVVGYQTIRKADLTGAVSVMDMKEPLSENSGNIMSSMAGKMPGVNVIPDAAPGGTGSIRIRGMGSAYSTNDPLYVVDGVPTDNINMINPSDIESMQVLKDAASASIYGSRAANGVVIITTKHGKGDRLSINVNYAISAQTIAKRYKVLNTEEWGRCYWAAAKNSGLNPGADPNISKIYGSGDTPVLQQYIGGNENWKVSDTDWQDAIYRTAWTNNLTASVANNTEKGSVLFSLNMIDQQGNLKTSNYRRYSARINSRYDFNKYITIGENLQVAQWSQHGADVNGDRGIPLLALQALTAIPVYGADGAYGNPFQLISNDKQNPVQLLNNAKDNKSDSWRILGNAFLEIKPIDGLSLKTNIGIEHSQFMNTNLGRRVNPDDVNEVFSEYVQGDTWTWTNTANYVKTFAEKHNINILLGTEAIGYNSRFVNARRQDYMFEDSNYMTIGAGNGEQFTGGGKDAWGIFSLFAKADYNFSDRYLVSFTIRRDENSRFSKKNRAGIFPAASVAWRPSAEPFWPVNDVVTDMKVRYSWGQNGNANIGQLYPTYSSYRYDNGNGSYDINGTGNQTVAGIILAASGNPNLKWETTTQNNVGLDMRFFNGTLNLTGDFYYKKTTGMLTCPPALSVAGQNADIWLNTGSMRNIGWEVSLGYNSPTYGDFSWNGSVNVAQYKNKLMKLNNRQEFIGGDVRMIPGEAMGVYYGYVCDGIFNTEAEVANHAYQPGAAPGRLIYRDLDGNGVIDDNDRCIIGNPNPDLTLGLNLAFKYKAFTLDMFFSGDFGFDIINHTKGLMNSMSSGNVATNRGRDLLNAWTPQNNNTDVPALSLTNDNSEDRFSTYYVENGSYFKMKYIKLSYMLPERVSRAIGAQSIDVFGQVENVFTATDFKGLDPEILPGEYGGKISEGGWPRPRTFTLGVNFAF